MKKNLPDISILMASYGNENYIEEAIRSVINQTFQNWELIIVDDLSPDNSNKIVEKYRSDERIKLIHHEVNQGLGASRKTGVSKAAGMIGVCLDPDDRLKPQALQVLLTKYKAYPNAAMIIGALDLISEEGGFLGKQIQNSAAEGEAINALEITRLSGWMTFRIEKYNLTGGYSGHYRCAEDQDLCFKIEEVGDVIFVKEALYDYRRHKSGLSQGNNRILTVHNHVKAMEEAVKRRGEVSPKARTKIKAKKYMYFRLLYLQRKGQKDFVGALRSYIQSLRYYGNKMEA